MQCPHCHKTFELGSPALTERAQADDEILDLKITAQVKRWKQQEAEIERLHKAGDAMATEVSIKQVNTAHQRHVRDGLVAAWRAAKGEA